LSVAHHRRYRRGIQIAVGVERPRKYAARLPAGREPNGGLGMLRMPVRALQTIAVFALCFCSGLAAAGPLAGSVAGLSGQVFVDRGGQRYGLRLGDQVFVDDAFAVPAGAKLKLRMNDGSILSLASETTLRINAYALNGSGQRQSAVMSLGSGLVRAITAPGGQPSVFEVNTAVGTSGARSTDWFSGVLTTSPGPGSRLSGAAPGTAYVVVVSGTVALTSRATGQAVLIPPGYGSRLDAGRDPYPPVPHTQAEFDRLIDRTNVP
jgi:hypothetical protein